MMKGDFAIHEGWGNHIEWLHPEQFEKPITDKSKYDVYGHLPKIPRKGQTLIAEFKKSFIKFRFIKVKRCDNPNDMFFAVVKPIDQEIKDD